MTVSETDVRGRHELDLDHHSPHFRDHFPEVIRGLHASGCPLGHSSHHGGFWTVYGYEALYDAVQDPELFVNGSTPEMPKGVPPSGVTELIPIDIDGPMVQEYRRIVLSWLSPGGAKALEPRIREMTTELIDEFIERGRCDLSEELLRPVPARLVLEILGWDADKWPAWINWVHTIIHERTAHPEKAAAAGEAMAAAITGEIENRRNDLTDDLFSDLLRARPNGTPLTESQLIGFATLLLFGGMDTTAGLTGNVIELLDRQPELRQSLIDDPSLMPKATEEFLRHESPSVGLYRTVSRDAVFHGQQLRKGDRVVLMFPAAGVDPTAFDEPDEIRFDRTSNRHMAFGLGVHRCLGSHHARVMFQVMLDEVLRRLPDFRISGAARRFEDAGDVYGILHLPLEFTPGPRSTRAE